MISKAKNLLSNLFLNGLDKKYQESYLYHKIIMMNLLSLGGISILLLNGTRALIHSYLSLALFDYLVALIALINFFYLRISKKFNWSSYFVVALVGCLMVFLFFNKALDNTGFIWYFIYPLLATFLLGTKGGLIASLLILFPVLLSFTDYLNFIAIQGHDLGFKIRFLTSYSLVVFYSYIFENFRERYYKSSLLKTGELKNSICQLENSQIKLKNAIKHISQASRLALIGSLSENMAHEVNDPLAIAKENLEKIDDYINNNKKEDETLKTFLDKQTKALARIDIFINNLSSYLTTSSSKDKTFDVHKTIMKNVKLVEKMYSSMNINFEIDLTAENPMIKGNIGKFQQVIMNLISNAKKSFAANKAGLIKIQTESYKDKIVIIVTDNGSGYDKEQVRNIFDSFFTNTENNNGNDFGLSITFDIIKEMNGEIFCSSEPYHGASFTIVLPTFQINKLIQKAS